MRRIRKTLVLFLVISCLVKGLSYAQPKISKRNIPVNIPAEVREQIEKLYSPNSKDREKAVREFFGMGEKAAPAVPFLISLLKDEDLQVRWYAASTLGDIEDIRAVEPLIAALKEDKDWRIRQCVAVSLMYLKDPRAVEQLIVALKDENKSVRYAAALALGSIKDSKAVESLIAALKDNEWDVRAGAVAALAEIKDIRAISPLIDTLEDKHPAVREIIAKALRRITGENLGQDPVKWQEWYEQNK